MKKPDRQALRLWRLGFTYQQIADFHGLITAGAAERLVSEQRSEALGLPSPYPEIHVVAHSA